jgi:hypothetical protein
MGGRGDFSRPKREAKASPTHFVRQFIFVVYYSDSSFPSCHYFNKANDKPIFHELSARPLKTTLPPLLSPGYLCYACFENLANLIHFEITLL